jgi:DNA invertase Pin-like site-specific DNA recombinase
MRQRTRRVDPNLAVAYLRVSTDRVKQELGLAAQRQAIERWAEKEQVRIIDWVEESISGSAPLDQRLGLIDALGKVAAGCAGRLVVSKLDRFSRDSVSAALAECELRKCGACLAVVEGGGGDDPTSLLIRQILLAVAQFERLLILARINAAISVKRRRHELLGTAPYGFQVGEDGKSLVPNEAERAIVEQLRTMRGTGTTVRDIVAAARERGVVGRRGRPLGLAAVFAIVRDVSSEVSEQGAAHAPAQDDGLAPPSSPSPLERADPLEPRMA